MGKGHAPGIEIGCGITGAGATAVTAGATALRAVAVFFATTVFFLAIVFLLATAFFRVAGFFLVTGLAFFRATGLRAGRDFRTTAFFFFAAGFFFAGLRVFALAISCLLSNEPSNMRRNSPLIPRQTWSVQITLKQTPDFAACHSPTPGASPPINASLRQHPMPSAAAFHRGRAADNPGN